MRKKTVVCIGASLIDESYNCYEVPMTGTSNIADYHRTPGGVSRNIAYHLALLGNDVELITHFGTDPGGQWLMEQCQAAGIGISHSLINDAETGRFMAMMSPSGDLFAGAVSTRFETMITPGFLEKHTELFLRSSLILIDTNLSKECLNHILQFTRENNIPCVIEPVSVQKAGRLRNADLRNVLLITPNRDEMVAINSHTNETNEAELIKHILEKGVRFLWRRDGKNGSGIYSSGYSYELPAPEVLVKDTTGAGDAALAGWIHSWLLNRNTEECVKYGHAMASLVLQVNGAIYHGLTDGLLENTYKQNFIYHDAN